MTQCLPRLFYYLPKFVLAAIVVSLELKEVQEPQDTNRFVKHSTQCLFHFFWGTFEDSLRKQFISGLETLAAEFQVRTFG